MFRWGFLWGCIAAATVIRAEKEEGEISENGNVKNNVVVENEKNTRSQEPLENIKKRNTLSY